MKAKIIDGNKEIELPKQFNEEIRPDLIKRAFLVIQSNNRQPYGSFEEAGQRHSAELSKRRRKYRGSYGKGISRVKRKIMTRRGTQLNWVAAVTPNVVGGRRAHPPKPEKNWSQKINVNERRKAIRSAISATANKDYVIKRGHKSEMIPIIVSDKIEKISKVRELKKLLLSIGLKDELERDSVKTIRAGKGTMRGRKYKRKKGILFVVSNDCGLMQGAKNLAGSDIVKVNELNVNLLAPGGHPGRLCIWSESAINKMAKENLFYKK